MTTIRKIKIKRKIPVKKPKGFDKMDEYLESEHEDMNANSHPKIKKNIPISGALLENIGKRNSARPVREWTDEYEFYDAIQNFMEEHDKPWTHAKLAYEMGIGSVASLYEYMEKGGMYQKAIEEFNLLVEDDLIRGGLDERYHGKMAELYLKTYVKKYTERKDYDHMPKKIQMVVFNSNDEFKKFEEETQDNLRKLLDVSDISAQTEVINNEDISDK